MQPSQLDKKQKEWQYRNLFDAAIDGLIIIDLETGCILETNPAGCRMHAYPRDEFIGLPLTAFIHPDSQNEFNKYIQSFQSTGEFDARVVDLRRDGSTFFAEWRGATFTHQGRSCLLGMVRDVSKRIQVEKHLQEQVETRTREQTRLLEISHTLASKLEFQPGLILDQLREIVQYTHGGLFALEDSMLTALAMRGTPKLEQSVPVHIHLRGPEILTALFNGHRPIRIADVWSANPQAQFLRTLLDDGAVVLLEGVKSWMWVPLAVRGRIIGGIGVAEIKKNHFTAHHADLALSVANQAAIAMTNAELYRQAQALAVLEERQRLARNLHDAVNQSLFSAGLIAEVLPRLWERDQEEARKSIEDLRRLTRGAQAEMRALLAELRPATITDSNLGDLLSLLGDALSGRTNIRVKVTGMREIILPSDVQITFYRVCQEALFNVAKHSKAGQVEINLIEDGASIEMRVRDDGRGFDPRQSFSGHYGLSMMRERAEAIGAEFSITSQAAHGTQVRMRWTPSKGKEVS